jgi:hypothetical protein
VSTSRKQPTGGGIGMRLVGLVSLVALIFLLSFRSLLHQQVLVGKCTLTIGFVSLWSAGSLLVVTAGSMD